MRLAPESRLARLAPFAFAAALGGAGMFVAVMLPRYWPLELPFVAFYPLLIMGSGWVGGFWPGILCTVLCTASVAYWLQPTGSFLVTNPSEIVGSVLFFAIGVVISALNGALRAGKRRETDARRAAERATEAERAARRAQEEVLAIVAHDLRSPLGAIQLNADLIEQIELAGASASADLQGRLGAIRRTTLAMNRILGDLLDVAAIDAGKLAMELSPCEVDDLLRESLDAHAPAASSKKVALEVCAREGGGVVLCDRARVLQILANLLGNALKFTPPGGRVCVDAQPAGDAFEICVRDTGPGIPVEVLPRVFERHWHERRSAGGGSGLGLFIARAIVEAHGGALAAASGPGEGASFRFTLPRVNGRA